MRTMLVLVVVLGTAGQGYAEALRDEVRLSSAADVKALCAELGATDEGERDQALAAIYAMPLPAGSWTFAAYDSARARLAIDGERGFRGPKGQWELVLHELGAGKASKASKGSKAKAALDMAVPATGKEATVLLKARKAGTLTLTVWFRPTSAKACVAVHTRDGDGVRLAIEPVAFELARGEEIVASGQSDAFAALRDAEAPVGEPVVAVQDPVLTKSAADAPAEVTTATRQLSPRLLTCYRDGLDEDPMLRGTLVIGVDVEGGGRVASARAELDGLGAPAVTRCALAAVKAARFPSARDPFSFAVNFGPR